MYTKPRAEGTQRSNGRPPSPVLPRRERGAFQFYCPPWYDLDNEILRGAFRPPSELHSILDYNRDKSWCAYPAFSFTRPHDRGILANPRVTCTQILAHFLSLFFFRSSLLKFSPSFSSSSSFERNEEQAIFRGRKRKVYNSSTVDTGISINLAE